MLKHIYPGYKDPCTYTINCKKSRSFRKKRNKQTSCLYAAKAWKESMLCSEFFPAWYLGNNPNEFVIQSTYAQELADDFGRKVRNQIASPDFNSVFPQVGLTMQIHLLQKDFILCKVELTLL